MNDTLHTSPIQQLDDPSHGRQLVVRIRDDANPHDHVTTNHDATAKQGAGWESGAKSAGLADAVSRVDLVEKS